MVLEDLMVAVVFESLRALDPDPYGPTISYEDNVSRFKVSSLVSVFSELRLSDSETSSK